MQLSSSVSMSARLWSSAQPNYSVAGFQPRFTADFLEDYFLSAGSTVPGFSSAITHSASGLATMTGGYGPEKITDTSWTLGSGWSLDGDVLVASGTADNADYSLASDGKTYEVTFRITDYVSGGVRFRFTGSANNNGTIRDSNGVFTQVIDTTNGNTIFRFDDAGSGFTGRIDNISVREIPKIQWAPHNLLTYSEDFSASDWAKVTTTVTANAAVAPDGTNTADTLSLTSTSEVQQNVSISAGATYTARAWVKKSSSGAATHIRLSSNNSLAWSTGGSTKLALTDDWQIIELSGVISGGSTTWRTVLGSKTGTGGSDTDCVGNVDVWGAHLYRSDLGGMADVPASERVLPTATTYVRTAGRVIGSEFIDAQGDLYSQFHPSSWTIGVNSAASDGTQAGLDRIQIAPDGSFLPVGNYRLSFDVVSGSSVSGVYSNAMGGYITDPLTVGHYEVDVLQTSVAELKFVTGTGDVIAIDNISVKEIDVNPAAARYLPRRGHHAYNGSQWVNKGLLVESEARTNLITQSGDMADAIWLVQGGSWGAADTNGWQEFTADGATSKHRNYDDVSDLVDGSYYTLSVDMEYVDYQWAFLAIYDGVSTYRCWFDLQNGTKGTTGGSVVGHTMETIGSNQYRCSITITADVSASGGNIQIGLASGDGSFGVFATGGKYKARHPQFEAGSTPSSYIPTNGATVTRPAESITIPAANLPWPNPVYVTGEELVTNGTFDTGDLTGFTDVSIGTGAVDTSTNAAVITSTDGSNYGKFTWTGSGMSSKVYQITFTVSGPNNAYFSSGGWLSSLNDNYTAGTHTVFAIANSATPELRFQVALNSGTTTIDNFSVKQINPLALSIQMKGEMTYADTGANPEITFSQWQVDVSNRILSRLRTDGANTGFAQFLQQNSGTLDAVGTASNYFSPGINVPFNISSRHGSTFINGAVYGVALTEDTTPVALPDLENTDLDLAYDFMGTISLFRVWAEDIGDTGIEEASEPSTQATLFLSFDGSNNSYVDFEWSE